MTKPETELDRLLADAKAKLERMTPEEREAMWAAQRESYVRGEMGMAETSVMLSASPPAPSVGDVVTDWNHSVAARSVELMARDGDRMAAVLTAQAKTIEILRAKVDVNQECRDELIEVYNAAAARAATAESSLETARGALRRISTMSNGLDESSAQLARRMRQFASDAEAALPSPPITKTEG